MKKICLHLFNRKTPLYAGLSSKQKNFYQLTKPKFSIGINTHSNRKSKNYVKFIIFIF